METFSGMGATHQQESTSSIASMPAQLMSSQSSSIHSEELGLHLNSTSPCHQMVRRNIDVKMSLSLVAVILLSGTVPSAPTAPMISVINSTTLAFQWQPPVAPNTDGPLNYNVYLVRELGSSTNFVRKTTNQYIQLAIFNPFERVCFRVSARNNHGEGLNTSEECSRTSEAGISKYHDDA